MPSETDQTGSGAPGTAQPFKIGVVTDQNLAWPEHVALWQRCEALGFDSAWVCDHFQQPSRPAGPYFEGWTLLAALAARTERIRLGVLVSSNTFRHPALLAKEALTVDHVAGGRLEVGLGAGWFRPEHEAFGFEFPPPAELVDRFREAVTVLDLLLRQDTTTFDGRYYTLQAAPFRPRPLQQPRPPLTLGAHRRRMLRIVAEFADRWNSHASVAEMAERNAILDEECAAIGREPGAIIRSLYGWASQMGSDPWASPAAFADIIGQYQAAGVSEFLLDAPAPADYRMMERIMADMVPRLRAERPGPAAS